MGEMGEVGRVRNPCLATPASRVSDRVPGFTRDALVDAFLLSV